MFFAVFGQMREFWGGGNICCGPFPCGKIAFSSKKKQESLSIMGASRVSGLSISALDSTIDI
jgi:hypothetical protein